MIMRWTVSAVVALTFLASGSCWAAALRRMGLRGSSALRIVRVDRGSPADQVQMQPGDLLVEVNGQFPATLDDLGEMIETVEPGDRLRISFMRVSGARRAQWTTTVAAQ